MHVLEFVQELFLNISPNHTAWCKTVESFLGSQGYKLAGEVRKTCLSSYLDAGLMVDSYRKTCASVSRTRSIFIVNSTRQPLISFAGSLTLRVQVTVAKTQTINQILPIMRRAQWTPMMKRPTHLPVSGECRLMMGQLPARFLRHLQGIVQASIFVPDAPYASEVISQVNTGH